MKEIVKKSEELLKEGRVQEAIALLEEALSHNGENEAILTALHDIYLDLGDDEKALLYAKRLLSMDENNPKYIEECAKLLNALYREDEALEYYERVLRMGGEISTKTMRAWAEIVSLTDRVNEALEFVDNALYQNPLSTKLMNIYANLLNEIDRSEEAIEVMEEALELAEDDVDLLYDLSVMYLQRGDREKAEELLKRLVLTGDAVNVQHMSALGELHKFRYGDDVFKRLNSMLANLCVLKDKDKALLCYVAGKAFWDVEDYNTAFLYYGRGGDFRSHGKSEDLELGIVLLEHLRKNLDKDCITSDHGGYESKKPLFIVGMPRSGTTLTERIITGLDNIVSVGETNDVRKALHNIELCGIHLELDKFSPIQRGVGIYERGKYYIELLEKRVKGAEYRYIVNKLPENFRWLGFLRATLPNAKFIHTRRNPAEICLSAYRIHFVSEGLDWSDNLTLLGKYYRIYHETMKIWRSLLPKESLLEIRYEDMIDNPEEESRKIADFLDVEWKAECLEFHKRKDIIKTASMQQAREPIYKSSTNRWRKYEKYLKPLIDEIGDLIEEYEKELAAK